MDRMYVLPVFSFFPIFFLLFLPLFQKSSIILATGRYMTNPLGSRMSTMEIEKEAK